MGDALKGKVAVVTGSGQGIGRAIALGMAGEGAKVVTNNRRRGSTGHAVIGDSVLKSMSPEQRERLRKQLEESSGDAETTAEAIKKAGGEAVPFFGDVSDFEAAKKLIQTAVDSFGRIDILANVAGTFGFSPIWEMSEELWDKVTLTKPKGYFNCIRHAVPFMMKQKWGRIINCTSRAFMGDVLKHAEYCAANAGVVGLTWAVAKELASYGITCNAFAPFAKTRAAFELSAYDEAVTEAESPWMDRKFAFPLEITPSPDDVAPFINYLASDEAANINGKVFNVGGPMINLYSEPEISKTLVKYGGRWTLDELRQQIPFALLPPE
ncbi:MAG: SDR family NAD(P)-dependent oxidoreductase [Dehalococcoidia bacterium]|nr:MAG: SDR family NAD(P)-dependent oxidoreductase [Dehalococcoidia bacterium]